VKMGISGAFTPLGYGDLTALGIGCYPLTTST
jgi:hypothetical protein